MIAALTNWVRPQDVPTWALALVGLAVLAGWLLLYRLRHRLGSWQAGLKRPPLGRAIVGAVRASLAFAGVWLLLHAVARVFLLRTNWPLWPMALVGVLLGEAIVWLYELERRVVTRRTGLTLVGLRLALLLLVILMLLQPVLASNWTENRRRVLPILVDASSSMLIPDRQLPPHQRLRLAESFSFPPARRPVALDDAADALRELRENLLPEVAWLERRQQGKKETVQAQMLERRRGLAEKLDSADKLIGGQLAAMDAVLQNSALAQAPRAALLDVKSTLTQQVRPRLSECAAWTKDKEKANLSEHLSGLQESLARVVGALVKVEPALKDVGVEVDAAQYKQLAPADKAAVDAVAGLSRLELAKSALVHRPIPPGKGEKDAQDSLLERLKKTYDVKVYTFHSTVSPADTREWMDSAGAAIAAARSAPASTAPAATGPTTRPDPGAGHPELQRTDLAGALRKVLVEVGGEGLAGVLVLSDGQDNSRQNLEPLARQLGGAGAAFCSILAGGDKPPTDAAFISLEAPETVFLSDKMYIDAELKLDGLADKDVKVNLLDADSVVDSRTIHVAGDVFRTRVQLADEPKKAGVHSYRVKIEPQEGEVFADNNSYDLTLSVTDERTKVLLVDHRPRWEFRYLKNLFSGRDKTVRLQYLLLEPDRFSGQPAPPAAPASVTRPEGQEEATTMPAGEPEWLKFDVVIVGDVPAKSWGEEGAKVLKKFVSDRGGTIIFIAGANYLPGDYANTPLAELIPLTLSGAADQPAPTGPPAGAEAAKAAPPGGPAGRPAPVPEPVQFKDGFRIELTPDGRDHVVCRQDVQPDKSLQVWASLPRVYWRSPYCQVSPAGAVLAYAVDPDAPGWLTQSGAGPTATAPETLARMREQYQREHALLVVASHGLGKVMMLTFDQTWRLRYRVGDTYHHKFWGQVMRWATAGKLAGSEHVKMGPDRLRYPPHERPIVRAKMVREDFTPLVSEDVRVKVFSGDKLIGSVPMKYVPDSPGLYVATLDELPAGGYRLVLDAPAAAELLARDGVEKVDREFSVDPSSLTEQIELAGNRNLLGRLASLSQNGTVVPAYQPRRVPASLPPGTWSKPHPFQFELWDSWLLLALFCAVATAEWVLRKRVGLA